MPYAVIQDDEFMGYHISKGLVVIAKAWGLSYDENIFPDFEVFWSERWIENSSLLVFAWGFG